MVQILMPNGGSKTADASQTALEVIKLCMEHGEEDDALNYALVFLGRKLGADQKLTDVPHFSDARPIRLVRQKSADPKPALSRAEVTKYIDQCRQMHANLGEELEQKLETYMVVEGEHRFQQAVADHPRLFHEPLALSVVKDMRLLVPFVLENKEFPYEHPHCVQILKKALQELVAANRGGLPSTSHGHPAAFPYPAAPTAQATSTQQITSEMLNQALAMALGGGGGTAAATAPTAPAPAAPTATPPAAAGAPPNPYATQLAQLNEWGFTDPAENVQALMLADGDVEQAIQILISMREDDH